MKFYNGRNSVRTGVCFMLVGLIGAAGCSEEKAPDNTDPLHVAQAAMMAGTTQSGPRVPDKLKPEVPTDEPVLETEVPIFESGEPVFFETREAPTPYVMDIKWDEANAYDRIDASRIPSQVRSKIEVLPLPVLIPATTGFLDHAFAVTDDNWYTITADYNDHVVIVQSSRIGFEYNGPNGRELEERMVENDFQVSRASMIASIVFPAFGLVYTIEVSCTSPDTDARCTEDDYIFSLANAMGVAGGAR